MAHPFAVYTPTLSHETTQLPTSVPPAKPTVSMDADARFHVMI